MLFRPLVLCLSGNIPRVHSVPYMSKRKLSEVSLQIIVATNRPILGNDQKFLIFRPTKATNRAFIPLHFLVMIDLVKTIALRTLIRRINLPEQL